MSAYSTLGWLSDPVTGPMLAAGDGALAETLLHELVHATVYVSGRARFNEGVASFLGQEASVRFMAAERGAEAAAERRAAVGRRRQLGAELERLRDAVRELYESPDAPDRAAARRALEAEARRRIAALPFDGAAGVAERGRLNDACLALSGTYAADLPAYGGLLDRLGGDLRIFLERVRAAADADEPREALLASAP